jgi:universal stress protein E
MQVRNILAVMDKPKRKQVALARALSLREAFGAHLHLVAFTYHPMCDQRDTFETHQRHAVKKELMRTHTEWLRGQVLDAGAVYDDVTLQAAWAKDIAAWTVRTAVRKDFDLVVKSVHPTKSRVHTPTDWHLLRECPVPVLLTSGRRWSKKPIVLATLDLNRHDRAHDELNRKVLDAAVELARVHKGVVHCVYAIEVSRVLADLDIINPRKLAKEARERSSMFLKTLVAPYKIPASRVHMPIGKVGPAVNGIAKKLNADVLVMGTTARRGLKGLVIGNSAERVLAGSTRDVLALKP